MSWHKGRAIIVERYFWYGTRDGPLLGGLKGWIIMQGLCLFWQKGYTIIGGTRVEPLLGYFCFGRRGGPLLGYYCFSTRCWLLLEGTSVMAQKVNHYWRVLLSWQRGGPTIIVGYFCHGKGVDKPLLWGTLVIPQGMDLYVEGISILTQRVNYYW